MKPRLHTFYNEKVVGELRTKFNYKNVNEIPRIQKIVLNVGLGEATQNGKIVDVAEVELGKIAGQKAVVTHARKAISNFKLKENQAIGVMVTLRRQRMRHHAGLDELRPCADDGDDLLHAGTSPMTSR